MRSDVDVLVVGGGQAGLAVSHALTRSGLEHVVVEQGRIGHTWDGRWDSFRLVTPNHTIRLPGGEYRGNDPDGYLARDEIAEHLRGYASSFGAPVSERTRVEALRVDGGGFVAETASGGIRARRVVVCTGAYQRQHRPPFIADFARRLPVVATTDYRAPDLLPAGRVLVVGGGQSGCQIAEELSRAGREVVLAAGRAPAVPRRVAGRDVFDWLIDLGFFEQTLAQLPSPAARLASNPLATGANGGHDLNLRTLAGRGVGLIGHVVGIDGDRVVAADDLDECVATGDRVFREVCAGIVRLALSRGWPAPEVPEMPASGLDPAPAPRLADLAVVVNACGYRPAYEWIGVPGVVDDVGFPIQVDGASTRVPGLHFVGVPWLRTRKSPLLIGVGEDADLVVDRLAAA
ncbi:flavin-containing monooxygenase [Occultella kanbiaonis]|uniref:flavin-containing monooxygenase n=1 Tax=Occultella kanbiaonis TaxID=2675754 RepID=UPI0013D179D8|nr:NAD(P)/FAD-dependent oxidoreductase [Occultella kanbiaonis]